MSENYLAAVRSRKRTDRITGRIVLAGGNVIAINDSVLVKDSLRLSRELCSGRYRIGTFCLSRLRFSFFLADALGLDLTGAYTELTYGILVGDDTFEDVPLGRFYIDPVLSVRRRDIVSVTAFDAGVLFDREVPDAIRQLNVTPPELIAAVCSECGVPTDIGAGSLASMPNSGITVSAKEKQIQTCRDIVMWCAALMCGYAVTGRDGKLCVISAKYSVDAQDHSIIIIDRDIRADERESITVTDTRAYIKYLTAYRGSDVVNYTSSYVPDDDQASPASYTLEKNPLMSELTGEQCGQANRDWLAYIAAFKQRGVEARIFGDPAIDTGDTIMFRGGDVDQRSGIVGVVTGIEWNYRKFTGITCLAAQCCGSLENGGLRTAQFPQIRSQEEKRIDSAIAGSSGTGKFLDTGRTCVSHNDNEHNTSTCKYDSISGYKNSSSGTSSTVNDIVYSGANTVIGEHNTLTDGTAMFVHGKENTVTNAGYSDVGGDGNTVNTLNACTVNGNGNTVTNVGYSTICGSNTSVEYVGEAGIFGKDHAITGDSYCRGLFVSGVGAAVTGHGLMLVIGSGGNIFTVDSSGNVLAAGTYGTIGEDYAEYFEWADGNPDNEDRCGMLVASDGEMIIPADGEDILGAVSAVPSVAGGDDICWKGRYARDVYGRRITDSTGDPVISDAFDPDREYIPRSRRPEWSAVGITGRLIVRDDGSCTENGYCRAVRGIASHSGVRTNVRMLKRIDGTHIEVMIK